MMSLVTTAHGVDPKVLLPNGGGSGENSADPLQTPRALFPAVALPGGSTDEINRLILEAASAPSSASLYFPSTAELMMPTAETIRRANPFDLSFGKANRILGANRSILEQNGLVPATTSTNGTSSIESSATDAAGATASPSSAAAAASNLLSKLQLPPQLQFTNIGLLSSTDGNENALKTADFARLVQQMKDNGGLSAQNSFMDSGSSNAPKTADVLNAVLDIHMQTLATKQQQQQQQSENGVKAEENGAAAAAAASAASISGYLNSSLFNMHTPAGSAPNSAGVLASLAGPSAASLANVLASVAGANAAAANAAAAAAAGGQQSLFVPPTSSQQLSPGRQPVQQQHAVAAPELKLSPKILFHDTLVNGMHPSTSSASGLRPPSAPASQTTTTTLMTALQQAQHKQSTAAAAALDPAAWDPHDVKPVVSGASAVYEHDPMLGMHTGGYHLDELGGPRSNESGSSSTRNSSSGLMHHGHAGRGRGRSTAEMPPDERRQTILERNKAAAVRYRKRKKEEHDEMITRCQQMEQERAAIIMYQSQNGVLRREVERLTAILKERECKCSCLRGVPMAAEMRERHPGDAEILDQLTGGASASFLQQQQHGAAAGAAHLMNGLHHFGAGAPKRPNMHKM